MKLNKLEFWLMNNSLRRLVQRKIEVKRLRKFSSLSANKNVLEIGCGSGYGSWLIREQFKPKKIQAVDLDLRMILLAKKAYGKTISFSEMDAASLTFRNNSFDAVFDFGIIHHIPQWKNSIKEISRVLKPGGYLIMEDLSIDTFSTIYGKILKRLLQHPYRTMYSESKFTTYLKKCGMDIITYKSYRVPLRHFLIIARKRLS